MPNFTFRYIIVCCILWHINHFRLFKAKCCLYMNISSNIEQVLETAPHMAAAVRSPITHHENYQN